MQTWMWIAIAVVIVLVAIIGAVIWERRRQGRRLRKRFGPEYERELARHDDRDAAHDELERRIAHRDEFELRELSEQERADYLRRWLNVQRTFTEHPNTALRDADELVTAVFVDIGYPSERFEDRAADLSVEHADVARDYREARAVVEDVQRGTAGTEEMRRAMLQYRGVFQRVADVDVSEAPERESQTWTTRPGLLPDEDRATLANRMQRVEETFIDDASASVRQADELVTDVVAQVRAALDRRVSDHRGRWEHNDEATTEQLRGVLRYYRVLFDKIASLPDPAPSTSPGGEHRSSEGNHGGATPTSGDDTDPSSRAAR